MSCINIGGLLPHEYKALRQALKQADRCVGLDYRAGRITDRERIQRLHEIRDVALRAIC